MKMEILLHKIKRKFYSQNKNRNFTPQKIPYSTNRIIGKLNKVLLYEFITVLEVYKARIPAAIGFAVVP